MPRCWLMRLFKKDKNKAAAAAAAAAETMVATRHIMLCTRCLFATDCDVSVLYFMEMHQNFNKKYHYDCSNNFIVAQAEYWKYNKTCSILSLY
ncbi:cyun95 [Cyclophragma undans nucleopolyhedrovirus]|uniref:Cyun95 n=1 Tax=Cyclophragma undans nucleopolyhedrovirus TaxID=1906244 RepID=A0A288QD44_9ABAC|nr:cyun95 [Cyclophragma undans nucleopolyhedrovirus]AOT85553.1 cyun95 [Cyclophragma undans nucleopolyhedrovirus]